MIKGIIFLELLTEKIGVVAKEIAVSIDKRIGATPESASCNIDKNDIVKVLPDDIQVHILQTIPDELGAIRFLGYDFNNLPYLNWIAYTMLQAEQKYGCLVAIKTNECYVRYLSVDSVNHEIRVFAAGTNALAACQYVRDGILSFNAKMFDSDGYRK